MKKWQNGKEEMQCRRSGISLWHSEIFIRIAKFCNDSENFAILAKFRYGQIFAIIAKITVRREIQIFSMPAIFSMIAKVTVHSENSNFCYA